MIFMKMYCPALHIRMLVIVGCCQLINNQDIFLMSFFYQSPIGIKSNIVQGTLLNPLICNLGSRICLSLCYAVQLKWFLSVLYPSISFWLKTRLLPDSHLGPYLFSLMFTFPDNFVFVFKSTLASSHNSLF